jgi:hypothetical protein
LIIAATTKPGGIRLVVAVLGNEDIERMRQGRPVMRYLDTLVPDLRQTLQLGIWTVADEAALKNRLAAGEDLFQILEEEARRSVLSQASAAHPEAGGVG